jgi:hypothetical protein
MDRAWQTLHATSSNAKFTLSQHCSPYHPTHVGSFYYIARRVILNPRILSPRFLGSKKSNDVAANVSQALPPAGCAACGGAAVAPETSPRVPRISCKGTPSPPHKAPYPADGIPDVNQMWAEVEEMQAEVNVERRRVMYIGQLLV